MAVMKHLAWGSVLKGRLSELMCHESGSVAAPDLALATWIRELGMLPPLKGHLVVLAIRSGSWIEFAAYAACWLRKLGYKTTLLYSSSDMDVCYGKKRPLNQRLFTGSFPALLSQIPDINLMDIDVLPFPTETACKDFGEWASTYAHTVAAYDLRVEEFDGYPLEVEYKDNVVKWRQRLSEVAAKAHLLFLSLRAQGVTRFISYSGLISTSPAFGEAARRAGFDVVFCEGWAIKSGHMICSLNQPALVYDIKAWLSLLSPIWNEKYKNEMDQFFRFQESNDVGDVEWLNNYHCFQRSTSTDKLPQEVLQFLEGGKKVFLLAPNCVGDSATLRVQTAFLNQRAWLEKVCKWFGEHPAYRLIIRAHPDELNLEKTGRLVLRMGDVAMQASKGVPNIFVIQGRESVSTYGLIDVSHIGLVWMSTVGVDMVVRGCPVIAAARPKYSGLGIVTEPQTEEEYFEVLESSIAKQPVPSLEQSDMGKKYLAILAREFSYACFSPIYRAVEIHVSGHDSGSEADTFYRMIAGELDIPTRPESRQKDL